jgi:hypothetical protein
MGTWEKSRHARGWGKQAIGTPGQIHKGQIHKGMIRQLLLASSS